MSTKILGLTIGVGEGWEQCAKRAAKQMQKMTGIECVVINEKSEHVHPSWIKTEIFEYAEGADAVMVFDADFMAMKPWSPSDILSLDYGFCACPDVLSQPVLNECRTFDLPFMKYYNCGFFLCTREAIPALKWAAKQHPKYGTWLEQTAINKGIREMNLISLPLPRAYNTLLWPGRDDYNGAVLRARPEINLHAASLGGDWRTLSKIQDGVME